MRLKKKNINLYFSLTFTSSFAETDNVFVIFASNAFSVPGKIPLFISLEKTRERKRGLVVIPLTNMRGYTAGRVSQKFVRKCKFSWIFPVFLRPRQAVTNTSLCDFVDKEPLCLEMDDVSRLFGLSFCMFVGCYVAGAIPLAFTMSEVSFKKR